MRPLNDAWFETLDRVCVAGFWNRTNETRVVLWISNYMDNEMWLKGREAEQAVMALGGVALSMECDRQCGKLRIEVIEPKRVIAERKAVNNE